MTARKNGRRLGTMVMATVLSGVVVSSATILKTSIAAFSATTDNGVNSWSTGTLELTANPATVLFNAGDDGPVVGGQVIDKCITVNYTGSWNDAVVKLYATAGSKTALAPFLSVVVHTTPTSVDTAGGSCAAFNSASPTELNASKKLNTFTSDHSGWVNAVGGWTTTSSTESKSYRFRVTVDSDNDAQGKEAEATFTWEVQRAA